MGSGTRHLPSYVTAFDLGCQRPEQGGEFRLYLGERLAFGFTDNCVRLASRAEDDFDLHVALSLCS
ncbi:hypothetical protein [Streptomyces cyaneofuscatus]|uniref:hypothetical protein n=1 Tax=Streptomyces cyaneofuscatus TaxID=66883 RepID=UPI0036DB04D1